MTPGMRAIWVICVLALLVATVAAAAANRAELGESTPPQTTLQKVDIVKMHAAIMTGVITTTTIGAPVMLSSPADR